MLCIWRFVGNTREKIYGEEDRDEFFALEPLVWDIALGWFKRESPPSELRDSEIAIVGYGEDEEFPSVFKYSIEGIANDHLKWFKNEHKSVNWDQTAQLEVVGQPDVIQQFVAGASRKKLDKIASDLVESYRSLIARLVSSTGVDSERTKIREGAELILGPWNHPKWLNLGQL